MRKSVLVSILLLSARPAFGQADYRNLDPGRPIAIEDAQPIEFRAFEFQTSIPRYEQERSGEWFLALDPELKWGFAKDWEFGVSMEGLIPYENGETPTAAGLHLLYNLNQETRTLPAVALRPEFTFATGDPGNEHEHLSLKLIVSRAFGLNRVHVNAAYALGPREAAGEGTGGRSLYGIAYERTFPIDFFVLLADLYTIKPLDGGRTQSVLDVGGRLQLTPTWVVDAGLSSGLLQEDGRPRFAATVGLSYVFSFRPLFPTGGI